MIGVVGVNDRRSTNRPGKTLVLLGPGIDKLLQSCSTSHCFNQDRAVSCVSGEAVSDRALQTGIGQSSGAKSPVAMVSTVFPFKNNMVVRHIPSRRHTSRPVV